MELKLKSANEEKETFRLQLSGVREEIAHLENMSTEVKKFYEEQYKIITQELAETNKIVESKTQ